MRESRLYGSVRGALSNGRPYRVAYARASLLRCGESPLCHIPAVGQTRGMSAAGRS
jgi:hypothetical protein